MTDIVSCSCMTNLHQKTFLQDFFRNSETIAGEFPANLEELFFRCYINSDLFLLLTGISL